MDVFIVGEDPVTVAIVRRVMKDYTKNLFIRGELPARGSEAKKKIANFNAVAKTNPVIMLVDLDENDCAPFLKESLLKDIDQNENFILNIAIDEAEAWLFADRENFSDFLKINPTFFPSCTLMKMNGPRCIKEINTPCKSSYYLTHNLALKSSDNAIRMQIGVDSKNDKCKGREYNKIIIPFIENNWDIENARNNSNSLSRMIERLIRLDAKFN